MHAKIEWQGRVRFAATSGTGHTLTLDGPPDAGGENAGPRPMELVLMGLGGCSSFDVVTILEKSRQAVTGCTAELQAERADEAPQVFTRIHLHFRVSGHDLDARKVARAVALSADKYCSAAIMLARGGVAISHDYEIVAAADERP